MSNKIIFTCPWETSDSLLIKWVSTENYILTCPMELYGDLSQARRHNAGCSGD